MIRTEEVRGYAGADTAYIIHYETPAAKGKKRFGGHKAREKATNFAVECMEQLVNDTKPGSLDYMFDDRDMPFGMDI